MQYISFIHHDPLVNLKNLAVFAHACGISINKTLSGPLRPRGHPVSLRPFHRRVGTGTRPSLDVALASISELPGRMEIAQKIDLFSQTRELSIVDVRDTVVNRVLL